MADWVRDLAGGRVEDAVAPVTTYETVDEAVAPFGGTKASGTGGHFGASANLDTCCDRQWVTVQSEIARYPF